MSDSISKIIDLMKANIHSDFLDSKSLAERNKILELTEQVTCRLIQSPYQSKVYTHRIIPIALIVSGAAPFCSVESLAVVVELGLWLFSLDDIVDENLMSKKDLFKCIHNYRDIIHGNLLKKKNNDELANFLNDICSNLNQYKIFRRLRSEWTYTLSKIIDSMLEEYHWKLRFKEKGPETLPSYHSYVESTRYSTGVPAYIFAMLTIIDDESIIENLSYIHKMENLSSASIRLANDLQSAEREAKEGKINSLTILSFHLQKKGLPAESTFSKAKESIEEAQRLMSCARCSSTNILRQDWLKNDNGYCNIYASFTEIMISTPSISSSQEESNMANQSFQTTTHAKCILLANMPCSETALLLCCLLPASTLHFAEKTNHPPDC